VRLDFGRVEPGQGARAFWPGEVQGLCGMLAVGVTRPGRGGWWLTPVLAKFHIQSSASLTVGVAGRIDIV
jgi:hypothetical protein